MNRRLKIVVATVFVLMLTTICVLSYNLYEAHKWEDIWFRHMMQAENELDRVRVIDFTDQRFGSAYKIRINRDEVKIEPVAESHSVTIPNPLYRPTTQTDK